MIKLVSGRVSLHSKHVMPRLLIVDPQKLQKQKAGIHKEHVRMQFKKGGGEYKGHQIMCKLTVQDKMILLQKIFTDKNMFMG